MDGDGDFFLWIFVRAFTKASEAFTFFLFFFFDISVLREYHDAWCKCVSLSMKIPLILATGATSTTSLAAAKISESRTRMPFSILSRSEFLANVTCKITITKGGN